MGFNIVLKSLSINVGKFYRFDQSSITIRSIMLPHRFHFLTVRGQSDPLRALPQYSAAPVCTIDDVYDCIGVGIIAPPVRSNAGLSSKVPNLELEVLVCHRLNIEPNCRDRCHHLNGWFQDEQNRSIMIRTSPACSRYKIVVLPAPSRPRIKIRISLDGIICSR